MCLLAICEKRPLYAKEFKTAWKSNPDGFGFAWLENGNVNYLKGLMIRNQAWSIYRSKVKNEIPHVVHFRYGTSGGVLPSLTHPFVISKESPLNTIYSGKEGVLFHNGILTNWTTFLLMLSINKIKVSLPYNDTRILAITLAYIKEAGNATDLFMEELSGKFAILTPDGVDLFGTFYEDKGIQFSNTTYKDYASYCKDDYDDYGYINISGERKAKLTTENTKLYYHGGAEYTNVDDYLQAKYPDWQGGIKKELDGIPLREKILTLPRGNEINPALKKESTDDELFNMFEDDTGFNLKGV